MGKRGCSAFGILCLLTLAVFAWTWGCCTFGKMLIADTNLETWLHNLDESQHDGIGRAFDTIMYWLIAPLRQ